MRTNLCASLPEFREIFFHWFCDSWLSKVLIIRQSLIWIEFDSIQIWQVRKEIFSASPLRFQVRLRLKQKVANQNFKNETREKKGVIFTNNTYSCCRVYFLLHCKIRCWTVHWTIASNERNVPTKLCNYLRWQIYVINSVG